MQLLQVRYSQLLGRANGITNLEIKAKNNKKPSLFWGRFFILHRVGTEYLGKRDLNPYWFNMEIFAVIASNALKILR